MDNSYDMSWLALEIYLVSFKIDEVDYYKNGWQIYLKL